MVRYPARIPPYGRACPQSRTTLRMRSMGQSAGRTAMPDDIWEANTVRLTLFPAEPLNPGADFWRPLFQSEPDAEETRPKEGIKRQTAPWGDGVAEVQSTPARLDVTLVPPSVETPQGQFVMPSLTFGPILEQLDRFAEPVLAWLSDPPFKVNRIAVSGNAMVEKETREETYEVLKRHIRSVAVNPSTMREFLYRINWQRPSKIVDYYNDIQFWSSINFQGRALVNEQMPPVIMQQKLLAQLQFDVSTPEDRPTHLGPSELAPIFIELLDLVRASVTEGERPL